MERDQEYDGPLQREGGRRYRAPKGAALVDQEIARPRASRLAHLLYLLSCRRRGRAVGPELGATSAIFTVMSSVGKNR